MPLISFIQSQFFLAKFGLPSGTKGTKRIEITYLYIIASNHSLVKLTGEKEKITRYAGD